MKITKKPLIGMALTSSVALAALSTGAHATNPFALQTLDTGYEVAGHHAEGKCGEAKCGGDMKEKAKEGKCGEAKCGGDMKEKAKEGKCGEAKCGGKK